MSIRDKIVELKCRLGFHKWEESAEEVKCDNILCAYHYYGIGWYDPKIKKIRYKRNSKRPYLGK